MTTIATGAASMTAPIPATPRPMRITSETAQMSTTTSTCSRRVPCRRMKAFCAPIAAMSEKPRPKPESACASGCMASTLGIGRASDQLMFLRHH